MNTAPNIVVDVDDRQQDLTVDSAALVALLMSSLAASGVTGPAEVGLALIDVDEMTALNEQHMGGSGPTDVLSFPIDGLAAVPDGQPAVLGDIVICPVVADRAPQNVTDEMALLVVHGALHLLGHDHAEPEETAVMQGLERELLANFHHRS